MIDATVYSESAMHASASEGQYLRGAPGALACSTSQRSCAPTYMRTASRVVEMLSGQQVLAGHAPAARPLIGRNPPPPVQAPGLPMHARHPLEKVVDEELVHVILGHFAVRPALLGERRCR